MDIRLDGKKRSGHRRQQGARPGDRRGVCQIGRRCRDPGARPGHARRGQGQDPGRRSRPQGRRHQLRRVEGGRHPQDLRPDHVGVRQDRHLRQQCRPIDPRPLRDVDRRDVAGRSRPQTVRADPLLPPDLPADEAARWGRIISVLNIGAKAPGADSAPTSVSRAAQMAFTKALSQEGAPHNVLVNSLHVGVIVSDQIKRRYDRERRQCELRAVSSPQAGRGVPMGRMGRAEEFANVATFLASDAACYVTGCAINVDGGRSPVV